MKNANFTSLALIVLSSLFMAAGCSTPATTTELTQDNMRDVFMKHWKHTYKEVKVMQVVDNGDNRNLSLGVRNLKGVTLMPTREVNPYHLLGHKSVLLSEAAARKFSEALAK